MNLHEDLCAILYEHGYNEPTDNLATFLIRCLEAHLEAPDNIEQYREQRTELEVSPIQPVNPIANYLKDKFPGFFESATHKRILDSLNSDTIQSLYLVPPGFGATTLFSVGLASYYLDQGLDTLVVSSHVNIIEQVEKRVITLRGKHTPQGSKFTAPGGNIRSGNYDIIIVDARSALDMPQGAEWFTHLLHAVELHTKIIVVGFINGRRSLTHKLSHDEDWTTYRFPAISDHGESIDPGRWPVEHFLEIRRNHGEALFQMNYQQNPPHDNGY